jgi:hypothetical protein
VTWTLDVLHSFLKRLTSRVFSHLFPRKMNLNARLLLLAIVLVLGPGRADPSENSQVIGNFEEKVERIGTTTDFHEQDRSNDLSSDNGRYLIITHDAFYNAVLPLAEWKHKKGMKCKVVRLSEIGSTIAQIRDYVVHAYYSWEIRPEFLLLVGAPNLLAFPYIDFTYTDNYYTDIDNDLYNDILSGRLTVHNETEAQTVVNKILLYERTPFMEDSLWFKNACLIVREDYNYYPPLPGSDDSIYWDDIRHAKGHMQNHEYNTIDTLSRLLGNNSTDVLESINNGRAFLLYRGSAVNYWWEPFDVNPDAANNGAKLPIVLSITCRTIGTGSTPAAAERWLLTGTPTTPRGGAGYFATTTVIGEGSHLRSAVCKGFFDALFEQKRRTFGEACEIGRKRVYDMYAASYEYQGFTTLGDPEMNIWTSTPIEIEVMHDSIIHVGDDSLYVQVRMGGEPVESALVCIVLDDVLYKCDYTIHGDIVFHLDTLVPGMMDVTVTGRNLIPYEGVIEVANGPGISEHEIKSVETKFRVSPTITKNYVNVSGIEGKVGVYNTLGQLLDEYDSQERIDLTKHPKGIYFLKPKGIKGINLIEKVIKIE